MSDEKSIYPRMETGYACTKIMNDELVEKIINQTFTQKSSTLKFKYYNPKNLIVQFLPVIEKEDKIRINRMRTGHFVDFNFCWYSRKRYNWW